MEKKHKISADRLTNNLTEQSTGVFLLHSWRRTDGESSKKQPCKSKTYWIILVILLQKFLLKAEIRVSGVYFKFS